MLPPSGILIADAQMRGINEQLRLSLPFSTMVLEWSSPGRGSKNILLLRELDADILLQPLVWDSETKGWLAWPPVFMDRDRYLVREPDGRVAYFYHFQNRVEQELAKDPATYNRFFSPFLGLLNCLACRNVTMEKTAPGPTRVAMGRKSPVPYDSFWELTIKRSGGKGHGGGGSRVGAVHASPRTHVRMGCIVRAKSGPHWRNSCVVNPDSEFRVDKIYKLAA